ncbi:uncharacterized protein LOC144123528 [Amblyomma americanum]
MRCSQPVVKEPSSAARLAAPSRPVRRCLLRSRRHRARQAPHPLGPLLQESTRTPRLEAAMGHAIEVKGLGRRRHGQYTVSPLITRLATTKVARQTVANMQAVTPVDASTSSAHFVLVGSGGPSTLVRSSMDREPWWGSAPAHPNASCGGRGASGHLCDCGYFLKRRPLRPWKP